MTNLTTNAINRPVMSARLGSPIAKRNEITFSNSKDKDFVLSHEDGMLMDNGTIINNMKWAMSLMTIFNKFFDMDAGNVPAGKIFDIGTEIDTRFSPILDGRNRPINWNQFLRNALSDMTNPNSDGGANITEKEIYDYYERCARVIPKDSYFSLRAK